MSDLQGARRSNNFLLAIALAHAGGVVGYLPLLTLLLPVKVAGVAGDARIGLLTACVIAGAVAASLSNILFGWLSDLSAAKGRARRPWIVLGLFGLGAAYAVIAVATGPAGILAGVVLFQVAVNAVLAPFFAIMAEEVPDAQKGLAGGLLSLGNPLASGFSALLIGAPLIGEAGRLMAVPLAVAACAMPLLLSRAIMARDVPVEAKPIARRDFLVAWCARLLIQVAGNVLSLYLLYYFGSIAAAASPLALAERVGHLLFLAFALPLPVALAVGRVSDRVGRRKPFLLGSAIFAALGILGMAAASQWIEGALAFGCFAIGSAVFLALHATFSMQLLPDPRHRGRDLGILNLANTLPALAGPALAWLLATPDDFSLLMLSLAGLTLAGGLLILAARGQR